jgi:hypothetical protein
MAPMLIFSVSSGYKKKEPRCTFVSEAKASHSPRMWAEVSSLTPPQLILARGLAVDRNN